MDSRPEGVYIDEGGSQRGERRDGRHGADDRPSSSTPPARRRTERR